MGPVEKVDKKEVFRSVANMEEQLSYFYRELVQLKQRVTELLEENHQLQIENAHLRRRLEQLSEAWEEGKRKGDKHGKKLIDIGEGYDNLARLYQEGFHICHIHYGSIRTEGDCLFCLSFLNKN
ncbi:DNA replication intiation control protein YabA [Geobacillus kaustophilus GBlys]|uniref:Replication initiation control protein YabA n=2 Tax=Anoxybacillaceae TaxID=3120669 RepID=U2WTA6_GEOKU|nr:Initiation-control protein [Geobacillus sp. WSUCF1]GAD14011.1 DNA replication intiation control protein YabA [Geobacillus kaustophilus GBlys]